MQTSTEAYKEQGLVRQTVIIAPETHEKLKALAKQFKIRQGEVVDVLIEHVVIEQFTEQLQRARQIKVDGRNSVVKSEMRKNLAGATPEQLAAIQAILSQSRDSSE